MNGDRKSVLAASLLTLASFASAQVASVCPSTNVCFKLNIPQDTASSGSGDIYFQISAPSSYEWVALGQGKGMSGSNMFLVYTSSDGSNVTLSPRTTTGHNAPTFNQNAHVQLLEGSGVSNGIMTANVKCSSCSSWSSGSMDFKASSGSWIYGFQSSGGPKNTDDQSANIDEHSSKSQFTWNFASAKGGSTVNPFVNAAPSASGSATVAATSCIPRPTSATGASNPSQPTQTSSGSHGDNDDDNHRGGHSRSRRSMKRQSLPYCDEPSSSSGNSQSSGNSAVIGDDDDDNRRAILIAHGVMASLAFVILFPAGAIAIRLASIPGIVWLHAAFQIFAYLVYVAAFGLGVYMAKDLDLIDNHHPIIGILVFVLLLLQPMLGFLHHIFFKKQNRRTVWSHAHIWLGRFAITLGIVNGGLGLQLADSMGMSSKGGIVAYAVIAVLVWLAWVAAMVIGERRKKMVQAESPSKYANLPGSSRVQPEGTEMNRMNGHYAPTKER